MSYILVILMFLCLHSPFFQLLYNVKNKIRKWLHTNNKASGGNIDKYGVFNPKTVLEQPPVCMYVCVYIYIVYIRSGSKEFIKVVLRQDNFV